MKLSPCPHDVIFGRGYKIVNRPGNQRYLKLVESLKAEYDDAPRPGVKAQFSIHVMHTIHNLSPPGRFLTKDKESGDWKELEARFIVRKIRQAFRDFKPSSNSSGGEKKKKTRNLLLSGPDSPSSSFCESKKKFRKKRVLADSAGKKNHEIIGESQNIVEKLLPKEQLHVESHSLPPMFPDLSKHSSGRSLEGRIQQSQSDGEDDESDNSLSSFILHYLEQRGQVELRNTSSNNSRSHQHAVIGSPTIHTTPMAKLGNKGGNYFPQEHDDDMPQLRSSWQELQLNCGGEDDENTEQWTKFVLQEYHNEYSSAAARRVTHHTSSPATTTSSQPQESDCIYMDEMDIHMEDLESIESIDIDGIDIDDDSSLSSSHFYFSSPRGTILDNKMMYHHKYSTKTEADQSSAGGSYRLERSVSLPESEDRKKSVLAM